MPKRKTKNARKGEFKQLAQLPRECRWARARMRGWNDYVKGQPFRASYDVWKRRAQYAYERGRMQAALAQYAYGHMQAALASVGPLQPAGLTLWGMDERIEGPMFRAVGETLGRKILEETRVARHR